MAKNTKRVPPKPIDGAKVGKLLSEVPTPAPGLRFENDEFQGLIVPEALKVLAREKASFYGHRAVLFAGFQAWLADPKLTTVIADAMAYECVRMYEKAWAKRVGSGRRIDLYLTHFKVQAKQPKFMDRIYYSIDAPAALARAYERAMANTKSDESKKRAETQVQEIKFMVRLASALAYSAETVSPPLDGTPKLMPAAAAVTKRYNENELSERTVNSRWALYKKALPYLYGASLIELNENTSLLDKIVTASADYLTDVKPNMRRWLGYANYFIANVVSKMKLSGKVKRDFQSVDGIDAEMPPTDNEFSPTDFELPPKTTK